MSKTDNKKTVSLMLALFAIALSSFAGIDLAFAESGSSSENSGSSGNDDLPDAPDNDVPEAEDDDAPDADED